MENTNNNRVSEVYIETAKKQGQNSVEIPTSYVNKEKLEVEGYTVVELNTEFFNISLVSWIKD